MKTVNKKINEIASKHITAVKLRGETLKQKYNDSDDFVEVSVWALENALKEAYQLGLKEGKI